MKKFKIFKDFKKEEQFLNEMAKKGYQLVKYNSLGIYTFKPAEPKNLNYKIDYRIFSKKSDFEEYCTLFKDAGWEHVCGKYQSGTHYFLSNSEKTKNGDIFSDEESQLERYKRFSAQCFVSLTLSIVYFYILAPNNWSFFDIRSWYFADNLWEMTGSMFWKAFLFETPFVILRIAPFAILFFMAVLYGHYAQQAKAYYKSNKH